MIKTEPDKIRDMLQGCKIIVPDYQRAYSWEKEHLETFKRDMEDFIGSRNGYYLGHFLFESTEQKNQFAIIDGQQRLTTLTIYLAALFERIENERELSEDERHLKEDMLKRDSFVHFQTVSYDRTFFSDYVLTHNRTNRDSLAYVSTRRIADAADFFRKYFSEIGIDKACDLLRVAENAVCTTHIVSDTTDAVQMFLFQNNRGKKPSHLEIVKALLMKTAYLCGEDDSSILIQEITDRFSEIYGAISAIEDYVSEDAVLACAMRLEKGSLYASGEVAEIEKELSKQGVAFAQKFSQRLSFCFGFTKKFFIEDAQNILVAHSLRHLSCGAWALPFVIKTYELNLVPEDRELVWNVLESLLIRQKMIGTKADLTSRLNDVFQNSERDNFASNLKTRLQMLCVAQDYWWGHWSDEKLRFAMMSEIWDRNLSKNLLWRYENVLILNGAQQGYGWKHYEDIVSPELEHIAPQTATKDEPIANGYDNYDDEEHPEKGIVSGHYLDTIGNHLILPKSHNCQIGNVEFIGKYRTYTHTESQMEVRAIADQCAKENGTDIKWTIKCIELRRDKIVEKLMSIYSIAPQG